jgi:hypothetical protein
MAKTTEAASVEKQYREYAVVQFTSLEQVVSDVKYLMERGWQAQGGIEVSAQGSAVYYYQAMVK